MGSFLHEFLHRDATDLAESALRSVELAGMSVSSLNFA
jgi:hypothetical protein